MTYTDMVDAEDEAHKLELAKGAVENTKKHFSDWGLIAQGLWIGQRQAMRAAGSNGPYGGPFKKAMKAWLVANPWAAAYDPPTRTHFIWLHDNRAEVEVWRETLDRKSARSMDASDDGSPPVRGGAQGPGQGTERA